MVRPLICASAVPAPALAAALLSLSSLGMVPASARTLTQPPDIEQGARVFASVCSACHLGGYNAVRPERTLQLEVLKENGMFAADAIEYQVTNGKNNMPAFGGRLTDDQITDAAYYVVYQAQKGWNKEPLYAKYPSKYVPGALMNAYANAAKPMK
mmetsp:Transcript_14229/g.43698  ORF Transcript_14229/g.43698 Transcript_14229/m.43698 type:complete len:155 (+) Transcript_14229:95-559(+)|eukprot:scaffold32017_cov40-Tisochrysis_lutea.AAC.1